MRNIRDSKPFHNWPDGARPDGSLTEQQRLELLEQIRQATRELEDLLAVSSESSKPVALDAPIGFARLKAKPETPFCLVCQSRSEGER